MFFDRLLERAVPGWKVGNPSPELRLKCGIFTGYLGICLNVVLAGIKVTAGILTGSVAIAADAANNVSDLGSSIITTVSFKMSAKPPSPEHPFGHGRMEYIGGLIVSVLLVSMGLNFLWESLQRIVHPQELHAAPVILILYFCTVFVKMWMFLYFRFISKRLNSALFCAQSMEYLNDVVCTSVVSVSAFFSFHTRLPLDGCVGFIFSGMLIWTGWGVMRET